MQAHRMLKTIIYKIFEKKLYFNILKYRRKNYFYKQLKNNKYSEKEAYFLKNILFPGDYCLDIGANIGEYTFLLSKLVGPRGKIFSIEPTINAFKILKDNYNHFKSSNVYLFKCAFGEKNGLVTMSIPKIENLGIVKPNDCRAHIAITEDKNSIKEEVILKTLDTFAYENSIKNINFIKCDVEGAELQVVSGGMHSLTTFRPIVLCEIEEKHLARYRNKMMDVFSLFNDLKFFPFYLNSNMLIKHTKYELNNWEIKQGEYTNNFFLIPEEKTNIFRNLIA